jgi:hypothetical protein
LLEDFGENVNLFPYYAHMSEQDLKIYFAHKIFQQLELELPIYLIELHAEVRVNSESVDLAFLYDEEGKEKILGIEVKHKNGDSLLSDLTKLENLISNGKINAGLLVAIVRRDEDAASLFKDYWDKRFNLKSEYDPSCNSREIVPIEVNINEIETLQWDAVFVVLRNAH